MIGLVMGSISFKTLHCVHGIGRTSDMETTVPLLEHEVLSGWKLAN